MASLEGRIELVKMILCKNELRPKLVSQKDIYGNTALHLAMYNDNIELVKVLLDSGSDVEVRNRVRINKLFRQGKLLGTWQKN